MPALLRDTPPAPPDTYTPQSGAACKSFRSARDPVLPTILKHLAEHFGIDGDILFERRIVGNREVVAVEEAEQPIHIVGIKRRIRG